MDFKFLIFIAVFVISALSAVVRAEDQPGADLGLPEADLPQEPVEPAQKDVRCGKGKGKGGKGKWGR